VVVWIELNWLGMGFTAVITHKMDCVSKSVCREDLVPLSGCRIRFPTHTSYMPSSGMAIIVRKRSGRKRA
jgi:hypothetical protein